MNQLTNTIRTNLDVCGELMEVLLNSVSLLFIVIGVISSLVKSVKDKRHVTGVHPFHTYFRMLLGGWLVVALEFQLAADVVGTIISPTRQHLIGLGVIAIIRTFLNYFLNKELHEERELSNKELGKV